MSKAYVTVGLLALSLFVFGGVAIALDPPHTTATNVNCNSCHTLHNSLGPSLTTQATNANLCMSCHNSAGTAASKPFSSEMQPTGTTDPMRKTSHSWSGTMPSVDSPNNPFGLRKVDSLTNAALKAQLGKFGTCSNTSYTTKSTCETNGGTWTASVSCSVCHNIHSQAAAAWDPFSPATYTTGSGSGRHFMRTANDMNQLCEDCHYYRTPASAPGGVSQTNVRVWDGNKKSHPMQVGLSGTSYNAAPVEPQSAAWTPQTGARYHLNGGADTNPTNNIVFDSAQQVRCLSCHGVHYTDSNSSTVDQP